MNSQSDNYGSFGQLFFVDRYIVFEWDTTGNTQKVYVGRKSSYSYVPPTPTSSSTTQSSTTTTSTNVTVTTNNSDESSKSNATTYTIIGVTVGVVAGLCVLCLLFVLCTALIIILLKS